MTASKIRLYVAASLDGYIATPDGSVSFLDRFRGDYGLEAFLEQVGTVILGRTTYDQLKKLGQWPYEGKRAYVLTTNEIATIHGNAKRVANAKKLISRLSMMEGGDVWVVGGGKTQRIFLDAGVIDQFDLFVMPIILGDGVPLFPGPATSIQMVLADTHTFPDGVVRLTYKKH